ncbi:hypothetical protein GMORB2_6254 [Geosmithia morbida]|uniref:Uncharacterized protein n=1 Tax=Geosmithia morbida TaxID=1094350 RepID=A0A9P4YXL4_9HYPO|nr:uncharacterized protein GMORB2_6254 [Geosmithia morbida]KAF4123553.1 hypothetical protein GMORB2_6254 [Geosmithia morbida]
MSYLELSHNLADAFNALADEAQALNDRRVVLEHKLRFAHEQFQHLADKYAPASPDITDTLAKLQLPPHTSVDRTSPVPLLRRENPLSQHHVAVVIRDGRRLASQVASMTSKMSDSTRDSGSRTSGDKPSSMSTALEQDFTIEGKKGNLQCPFSRRQSPDRSGEEPEEEADDQPGPMPHDIDDPICAAMYEESAALSHAAKSNTASKCPIRYMDKHSPEEIAHYVETHKHELPRSHEVCLRRYNNEEQVKQLDSKYGNIVSMVEGLGQLHQSMLRESGEQLEPTRYVEGDKASNERVQKWATTVTASAASDLEEAVENTAAPEPDEDDDDAARQGRFDRPLKEVRVGESPSRPWGISVPIYDMPGYGDELPFSPPPAPVRMSSGHGNATSPHDDGQPPARKPGKCPFDHTKLQGFPGMATAMSQHHGPEVQDEEDIDAPRTPQPPHNFTPAKEPSTHAHGHPPPPLTSSSRQHLGQPPAFIKPGNGITGGPPPPNGVHAPPQMVFTGPVFIGYPVDQAIQIMNQYRPPAV